MTIESGDKYYTIQKVIRNTKKVVAVARTNMDELNTNLEIKEVQSQLAGVLSQPHSNLTVTLFRNYLYMINRFQVLQ